MCRTAEVMARAGLLCERNLKAVEVPVEAAVSAGNYGAVGGGGRAVALVAKDGFTLGVFETEVIWGFFVASTVPGSRQGMFFDMHRIQLTLALEQRPHHTLLRGQS